MKSGLNVQDRLECARAAVAVLRALKISNITMRYNEFAKAIGLIPDTESWLVQHKQQVEAVLHIVAAVERQRWGGTGTDIESLEFDRVVGEDGKPGPGITRNSRIETN
jgi:hypothetical protein